MKTRLNNLLAENEQLKKELLNLKNNYIVTIYEKVIKHKPIKEIHKALFDETINKNVTKPLLKYAVRLANRAKRLETNKQTYSPYIDVLAVELLNLFTSEQYNQKAIKIINKIVRSRSEKIKKDILNQAIFSGRQNGDIFYVASRHQDCAQDHLFAQGKIYVDEKWRDFDVNGEIENFIKLHNIKTVQWVTGKPTWFITRPYCRHYFKQYSFNEILSGNYEIPTSVIGNREMQTPANANLQYYTDRYRLLMKLYKIQPTEKLKAMILKTKILINKWKDA